MALTQVPLAFPRLFFSPQFSSLFLYFQITLDFLFPLNHSPTSFLCLHLCRLRVWPDGSGDRCAYDCLCGRRGEGGGGEEHCSRHHRRPHTPRIRSMWRTRATRGGGEGEGERKGVVFELFFSFSFLGVIQSWVLSWRTGDREPWKPRPRSYWFLSIPLPFFFYSYPLISTYRLQKHWERPPSGGKTQLSLSPLDPPRPHHNDEYLVCSRPCSFVPALILTNYLRSSELAKLAANAFLAQRISSINAISGLYLSSSFSPSPPPLFSRFFLLVSPSPLSISLSHLYYSQRFVRKLVLTSTKLPTSLVRTLVWDPSFWRWVVELEEGHSFLFTNLNRLELASVVRVSERIF